MMLLGRNPDRHLPPQRLPGARVPAAEARRRRTLAERTQGLHETHFDTDKYIFGLHWGLGSVLI